MATAAVVASVPELSNDSMSPVPLMRPSGSMATAVAYPTASKSMRPDLVPVAPSRTGTTCTDCGTSQSALLNSSVHFDNRNTALPSLLVMATVTVRPCAGCADNRTVMSATVLLWNSNGHGSTTMSYWHCCTSCSGGQPMDPVRTVRVRVLTLGVSFTASGSTGAHADHALHSFTAQSLAVPSPNCWWWDTSAYRSANSASPMA